MISFILPRISPIYLFVFRLKLPEEQAYIGETEILLDEPSSPSFEIKRPQIRSSSSASLIPQISTKSEDDNQSIPVMSKE